VEANGVALHFLEWGPPNAPVVCFLHGGSAHAHWFDRVITPLIGRGHVIALDQRGHGESAWPVPAAYATEDFVADLLGVMDALGWRRLSLVGHSMGGHNAMAFSAWHPERVERLVVLDSRPAIPAERLGMMHRRGERGPRRHPSAAAAVAAFRLLPRETVAAPAFIAHLARASVVGRDGGWISRFDPAANGVRQPHDLWPHLPRIAAPTLILRAALSPVLPAEMAESLRRAIPGSRLVELPGAYHHLPLDRPDAVAEALAHFLL
jgi:pimeloyl-ACP methyl ester carboxylesterase